MEEGRKIILKRLHALVDHGFGENEIIKILREESQNSLPMFDSYLRGAIDSYIVAQNTALEELKRSSL